MVDGIPLLLCLGSVVTPWTVAWQAPLSLILGKNTGGGCHFLFQRILPSQGSDLRLLCFLHWQVDSLPLVPLGKLILLLLLSKPQEDEAGLDCWQLVLDMGQHHFSSDSGVRSNSERGAIPLQTSSIYSEVLSWFKSLGLGFKGIFQSTSSLSLSTLCKSLSPLVFDSKSPYTVSHILRETLFLLIFLILVK